MPVDLAGVSFVGRELELAFLRSALDRAACGQPQVVLIEGEQSPEGARA